MATFFQGSLPAVEWNPETKKPRFEFSRKLLTTSDKSLIAYLKERGYEEVIGQKDNWLEIAINRLKSIGLAKKDIDLITSSLRLAKLKVVLDTENTPVEDIASPNINGTTLLEKEEKEEKEEKSATGGNPRVTNIQI